MAQGRELTLLLFLPSRALGLEQAPGVGIVDAAQLLQAVPHFAATPGRGNHAFVHDHTLQPIVTVDHQHIGHRGSACFLGGRQIVAGRNHVVVPLVAGQSDEMAGVAPVAGDEIDEAERHLLVLDLQVLVGKMHVGPGPGRFGLRIVDDAEAFGPIFAGGGIVDEIGKGPGLQCRGGSQIGRELGGLTGHTGKDADQRRSGISHAGFQPRALGVEVRGRRLQHIDRAQADGHGGELQAVGAECELTLAGTRPAQDIVALDQHLDGQPGRQDFQHTGTFDQVVIAFAQADQAGGEDGQILGRQIVGTEVLEVAVVAFLAVAVIDLELGDGQRLRHLGHLRQTPPQRLEGLAGAVEDEIARPGFALSSALGIEALLLQHAQHPTQALAALRRQALAARGFAQDS